MNIRILLSAAVALSLSTPVLAEDQAGEQAAPVQKKICRTEEVTGSLIAKRRICMTKAEWDKVEQASKQNFDRFASQQSARPGSQTNPTAPQ